MRSKLFLTVLCLSCILCIAQAQEDCNNSNAKTYNLVLHCSLSGGMRQVHYEKAIFSISKTVRKKVQKNEKLVANHGTLESFVEIQYKTRLSKSDVGLLYDWIEQHGITQIQPVQTLNENDMSYPRYKNELELEIDSKKYILDHYTIKANPKLIEAINSLFDLGERLTATE
jgi:hypothetical protein